AALLGPWRGVVVVYEAHQILRALAAQPGGEAPGEVAGAKDQGFVLAALLAVVAPRKAVERDKGQALGRPAEHRPGEHHLPRAGFAGFGGKGQKGRAREQDCAGGGNAADNRKVRSEGRRVGREGGEREHRDTEREE